MYIQFITQICTKLPKKCTSLSGKYTPNIKINTSIIKMFEGLRQLLINRYNKYQYKQQQQQNNSVYPYSKTQTYIQLWQRYISLNEKNEDFKQIYMILIQLLINRYNKYQYKQQQQQNNSVYPYSKTQTYIILYYIWFKSKIGGCSFFGK